MKTFNPTSLEGKTILVTGASSGIGRAIALECSRLGARVICTARNEARLRDTLKQMEGTGHLMIPADLCCEGDRASLVAQLPVLDGVSHNVGMQSFMPCAFIKEDTMMRMFEANVHSIMQLQEELFVEERINDAASLVIHVICSRLGFFSGKHRLRNDQSCSWDLRQALGAQMGI